MGLPYQLRLSKKLEQFEGEVTRFESKPNGLKGVTPGQYRSQKKRLFFLGSSNFFGFQYFSLKIVLLERSSRVLFKNEVFLKKSIFKNPYGGVNCVAGSGFCQIPSH